jgi:predicted O-methyltransferase YrrM
MMYPVVSTLSNVRQAARAFAGSPREFCIKVLSELKERREYARPPCQYRAEPAWRDRMHRHLRRTPDCGSQEEMQPVWEDVLRQMRDRGIKIGPMSYLGWNDADPAFISALWCLARHTQTRRVVETGVAHGITSRFILEALAHNGGGWLWSIDLAPQLHPEVHGEIGTAVPKELRGSWTFLSGSSRRHLPHLLADEAPIDLFVHDSKHTAYNVLFEMRLAWEALRQGGAMVVDDVDTNWGFHEFCAGNPEASAWVCESEPLAPDPRRANRKGMFGMVIKGARTVGLTP